WAKPMASASRAATVLGEVRMAFAYAGPARSASWANESAAEVMERRGAGMPNFEPSAAKRMSHAIAAAIAPPMQKPKIIATVGLGHSRIVEYAAPVAAL